MTKKLIVANWKMSPSSLVEVREILEFTDEYLGTLEEPHLEKFKLVFCPPFIFIEEIAKILETSKLSEIASLGAQDIFWEDSGADTGEISGPMLNKLGVKYVIIGHSERRWKLGESDDTVNKKLKAALRNELTPIVCIGERERRSSEERLRSDNNRNTEHSNVNVGSTEASRLNVDNNFRDFLQQQVKATFKDLSGDEIGKCIIAYEPVWAISTNPDAKPDTPQSALESIHVIKDSLATSYKLQATSYLYGGSVNSQNISDFLKYDEISGVLVGSASVDKKEFVNILRKL